MRDEVALPKQATGPLSSNLPPLESLAISARFGTAVSIVARGEMSSSEQARAFADMVKGVKALNLLNQEGDTPLQAILGSLEIETLDEVVEVSFEVGSKALRDLLSEGRASETKGEPATR